MNVYNLDEITDSKLLYDKKPPRFMIYIVLIALASIVGFLLWSTKSIKTYVVKGQGLVTTDEKSNLMAKVSGEIKETYIEEGDEVMKGEILLVFNSPESKYQLQQVEGQIEILNKRIELLKRAEDQVSKGKNTFNKNSEEEAEFYNKLLNSNIKLKEYDIDEESLKEQNYTDYQIRQYKEKGQQKKDQIYYDTMLSFTNEKKQLEMEKDKLQVQKESVANTTDEYKLYAPRSGKIHVNTPLNKGMVIQGGSLLGTIATTDENIIVETLIPSIDRPRIHENDEVSLAVGGLNQAEYGTLKGQVTSIDEDATIDKEKGNVFFKVKVKPEKTYLEDKKGEKVKLTLGMVAETRVKYEKITYMKYFSEQIGVKLN